MAEIIHLREFQERRERAQRRAGQQQDLARAVAIMRENLAAVAERVAQVPINEQAELLDRVEKLAAMIRYGNRLLDHDEDEAPGRANSPRA